MASVSAPGSGSGLDVNSIITQLMAAERQPTTQRLNSHEADLQTKISAFGNLKSALSTFRGALSGLTNTSAFTSVKASGSDSNLFTATATSSAQAGSYSVKVEKLAQAQSLATAVNTGIDPKLTAVGTGTLTLRLGAYDSGSNTFTPNPDKTATTITIDATNNTLTGIRDAINKANTGVTAGIVDNRLTLNSATGAANSLQISVSDNDGVNTDTSGLSFLAYDPTQAAGAGKNMLETAQAQDAQLTINGLLIDDAPSNSISNVIEGVTLDLKSADINKTATLTVAKDSSSVSSAISGFVKAYNDLTSTMKSLTAYNAETGAKGDLIGDSVVRSIAGQVRSLINKTVNGASDTLHTFADIGIGFQVNGQLQLDSAKLKKALDADPEGVIGLLGQNGRTTDSLVKYVSGTGDSQPGGSYAINVTQLAAQGLYSGLALAGSDPITIDPNNDTFALKVNGAQSSAITLTQGTYTRSQLAAELQSRINSDSTLKTASAAVSVSYNASASQFSFTSTRHGLSSNVEFTTVDTNTQATLGIDVRAGTAGQDVQGLMGGVSATGAGQRLTGASGISVDVFGNTTGDRGKVMFSNGLGQQLDALLGNLLGSKSPLTSRTESLNKEVKQISEQRITLEKRMTSLEERYRAQFEAMDSLVSSLNSTSSYLAQQFSNMSSSNK